MDQEYLLTGQEVTRRRPPEMAAGLAAAPDTEPAPLPSESEIDEERPRPRGGSSPWITEPLPEAAPPSAVPRPHAERSVDEPALPGTPVAAGPPAAPGPPMPAGPAASPGAPLSRSFVTGRHVAEVPLTGWRRALSAIGLKPGPSAEEVERQADVRAISRHWPGPRTVAVANPKGGAGKTPTAMMCAALFARLGGSGVLAWCNNVTRGSLGWRGESGTHDATVLDLLAAAPSLMGQGAQVGQLAAYVRHQSEDRYEILASAAHLLPTQQRITAEDFDAIWRVVTKYYRLAIVDSGNEETAENWVRMVDRSDVLVVPMTNRRDHAEAAREMLQQLRTKDAHSAWLSRNAVVVVSEASSSAESRAYSQELAAEFGTEGRDVVVIPEDPGIGADWLRYDGLGRRAQREYLRTAALIAARLDHPHTDSAR